MIPAEQRRLRDQLLQSARACFALPALLIFAAWLIWHQQSSTVFLPGGQLLLILPLILWWLWLLRQAPSRVLAILSDLKTGDVSTVSGRSTVTDRRGIGIFAPSVRFLLVRDHRFSAADFAAGYLLSGAQVIVRYASASRVLLSVEEDSAPGRSGKEHHDVPYSERERALLSFMAEGLSDKLIARQLALSPATVRTYNSALFRKLGVNGRNDALDAARQLGLIGVN